MRANNSQTWSPEQRGALLIAVLFILLVTTILGVSAMKASGLEMQMSSNSREHFMMLEAAEYAIAEVTNQIHAVGGFSNNSLANTDCDNLCFDEMCSGGYCFFGAATSASLSWESCAVGLPAVDPSQDPTVWADGSGRFNSLAIPDLNVIAKYIIEFRCYAAIDDTLAMTAANNTQLYRITTLIAGANNRSGVMLRVTVKSQ